MTGRGFICRTTHRLYARPELVEGRAYQLLRGYNLVARLGCGAERVPRQRRAFHADGELADACQHGELAEILDRRIGTCRDDAVKALEQRLRFSHGLALDDV